jgi:hypothetical protein
MHHMKTKRVIALVVLLMVAGVALASIPAVRAGDDSQAPVLPSPTCDYVQVPPGNEVAFHVYALGVQINRWDGDSWEFMRPEATLYANPDFRGKVGTHYRGPTWESNSGRNVVAKLMYGCSPDSTAIDWLLLRKFSTEGPGIFGNVTFIQRVNTAGGLKPTEPGSSIGQEKGAPYTAEYYFYRAED